MKVASKCDLHKPCDLEKSYIYLPKHQDKTNMYLVSSNKTGLWKRAIRTNMRVVWNGLNCQHSGFINSAYLFCHSNFSWNICPVSYEIVSAQCNILKLTNGMNVNPELNHKILFNFLMITNYDSERIYAINSDMFRKHPVTNRKKDRQSILEEADSPDLIFQF